jgi:hypothetical protein
MVQQCNNADVQRVTIHDIFYRAADFKNAYANKKTQIEEWSLGMAHLSVKTLSDTNTSSQTVITDVSRLLTAGNNAIITENVDEKLK